MICRLWRGWTLGFDDRAAHYEVIDRREQ